MGGELTTTRWQVMVDPQIHVPCAGQRAGAAGNLTEPETRDQVAVPMDAPAGWALRLAAS